MLNAHDLYCAYYTRNEYRIRLNRVWWIFATDGDDDDDYNDDNDDDDEKIIKTLNIRHSWVLHSHDNASMYEFWEIFAKFA